MKKVIVIVLLFLVIPVVALGVEIGDRFHVTGCKDGELLVPIVNLWSEPDGGIVIGKLSGHGRADQGLKCQGSVVKLLEIKIVNNKVYLKIIAIVNPTIGWITDSFVGRKNE